MPFLTIENLHIHFESIRIDSPVKDTVVIFLHEALGSIAQWRSFPEQLCKELKLNGIVYERQGHGHSSPLSKPRDHRYLHEYAWSELPILINSWLAPQQKVILIGHSDGGTISLLYASRFLNKVDAVVTIAAHVINESETVSGILPAVSAFKSGKLDKLKSFHGTKTKDLFNAWADTWLSEDFANWDITADIQTIKAPLFIIQGERDQYGTKKQVELIKNSVIGIREAFLIPKCGHHPHLENNSEVITAIKRFLHERDVIF